MEQKDKIPYLNLIQGVITRLSNHNTTVRNWTIVSLSALLALEASHQFNPIFEDVINGWLIGVFLWMSLFYHYQERCYIALYEKVIDTKSDCSSYMFVLRLKDISSLQRPNFGSALFSSEFNMIFCLTIACAALGLPWIFRTVSH